MIKLDATQIWFGAVWIEKLLQKAAREAFLWSNFEEAIWAASINPLIDFNCQVSVKAPRKRKPQQNESLRKFRERWKESRCPNTKLFHKSQNTGCKRGKRGEKVATKETWESTGKSIGCLNPLIGRSVKDFIPTNLRTASILRFLLWCLVVFIAERVHVFRGIGPGSRETFTCYFVSMFPSFPWKQLFLLAFTRVKGWFCDLSILVQG